MGSTSSIQVVMVGLEKTGKTTLLYHLKFGQYTNTVPTIGFNCEKVAVREGKAKGVTFTFWDVGGKDNMRPLWKSYIRSADGILFVVDSSDIDGMEEARIELFRLVKNHNPAGLPVLVMANKQDLPSALSTENVARQVGVNELSSSYPCSILPSCAVTGEGLLEAMDTMCELVRNWKRGKSNKR